MTTPVKRARGRPKKAAENPDCEVATKGYVKCVARNVIGARHTHTLSSSNDTALDGIGTCMVALGFFSAIGWYLATQANLISDMQPMFAAMFWVSLFVLIGCLGHSEVKTTGNSGEVPQQLQPYEPPCEPKRECE